MDFSSYYLKRDELDFNYFMEDDAQGGSTKLLWDLTAKNRTEYLEFKIMAQRKTDDSSPLKLEHQNGEYKPCFIVSHVGEYKLNY